MLIFDEAHMMPLEYLQPCLRAVAFITRYLNSEAIFLTATMPDLSRAIKQYALPDSRILGLIEEMQISVFGAVRYRGAACQSGDVSFQSIYRQQTGGSTTVLPGMYGKEISSVHVYDVL